MIMSPTISTFNWHPVLVLFIIVLTGFFGGVINYYYSFEGDNTDKTRERFIRCILLSIGASLLVPNFLQMISSPIIEKSLENPNLYLILIGFCLVFAIFSRRFITSIGDRILASVKSAEEKAENAEEIAKEAKKENNSTKEEVKDLNVALSVSETAAPDVEQVNQQPKEYVYDELISKAESFVKQTSIGNYAQRLELKASLGREMGLIIINNNLDAETILARSNAEGVYLAICYAVKLKPRVGNFTLLNKISGRITQKFTKYQFCDAVDKLILRKSMKPRDYVIARTILGGFIEGADQALINKIKETTQLLNRRVHGLDDFIIVDDKKS